MSFFRKSLLVFVLILFSDQVRGQDLSTLAKTYRPALETNLIQNIAAFWYPGTIDRSNGGYILNHDLEGRQKSGGTKMIVTQSRMLWLFSRLARAGYSSREYLEAADSGYRFLMDKMRDEKNGGFFWEVDMTGDKKLRRKKHLYGQSFALYALSEHYLATGKKEALDAATDLFMLMESKAHDATNGGYVEWFNEDWTPAARDEVTYMGEPGFKLMNTHLHLLESVTCFYRASKLPLARERVLELIRIQSNAVVRKGLVACTDKYEQDWTPVLTGNYARVSYGHDLENIWLLMDACDAVEISNYPLQDLYRALFDYSLKYGYDESQGGFYNYGSFNKSASNRDKVWWVQAEALVSALDMYRLTKDPRYLEIFRKTYGWVQNHQVDWKHGEWHDTITPAGSPKGDKAQIWKDGYHNGRAMIECLEILKSATK
jgi:mannobiose 2-epimerase